MNISYYYLESCLNSLSCFASEVLTCNSNLLTCIHLHNPQQYPTTRVYFWNQKSSYKLSIQSRVYNQGCARPSGHQWYWKSFPSWEPLTYSKLPVSQRSKLRPRKMKNLLGSQHHFQGLLIDRLAQAWDWQQSLLTPIAQFWHHLKLPYGIQQAFPEKPQ